MLLGLFSSCSKQDLFSGCSTWDLFSGCSTRDLFSGCSTRDLFSSCVVWAPSCSDIFCCWAQALGCVGFSRCGFWTLEHRVSSGAGLRCYTPCGILRDHALDPCLLHWQADSLSPSHQGSPQVAFYGWSQHYLVPPPGHFNHTLLALSPKFLFIKLMKPLLLKEWSACRPAATLGGWLIRQ